MIKRTIKLGLIFTSLFAGLTYFSHAEDPNAPIHSSESTREFTVVAIEYMGTKVWVPGTLIVKKNDWVKIKLISNIKNDPNTHGFAIDSYHIKTIVARGEPQNIEFKADQAGLFNIYCQLHPAHIGGQLLVLE